MLNGKERDEQAFKFGITLNNHMILKNYQGFPKIKGRNRE
jgi:hypothetical protein